MHTPGGPTNPTPTGRADYFLHGDMDSALESRSRPIANELSGCVVPLQFLHTTGGTESNNEIHQN